MRAPWGLIGSDPNPAVPTHLRPCILGNDLRPVPVVRDMVSHPSRECDVMSDQAHVISASRQAAGLGWLIRIEETNSEAFETLRRRRRPNFAGRNGIAAQKEVFSLLLNLESPLHRSLNRSMAPFDIPLRSAAEHPEFSRFQDVGELRFDQFTDSGLAHAAGARDEEEHTVLYSLAVVAA